MWRCAILPGLFGLSVGCAQSQLPRSVTAPEVAPYLAVQKPVPEGEDRIYLLAAIPGRIVIRNDCVLFERMDAAIVLPVFESGMRVGIDERGAWLFDPVSKAYFRDGSRVAAGGGGSETIEHIDRRNILARPVPARCVASLSADVALVLNPGIEAATVGQ